MILENRWKTVIAGLVTPPKHGRCGATVSSIGRLTGTGSAAEVSPHWRERWVRRWTDGHWNHERQESYRICGSLHDALDRLAPYRSTLLELVDADSELWPRDGPHTNCRRIQRSVIRAIQDGLIRATEIPSRTCKLCAEAFTRLEELRAIIHINVASDLQVGMQMLRTSLRGAIAQYAHESYRCESPAVRLRYEDLIVTWNRASAATRTLGDRFVNHLIRASKYLLTKANGAKTFSKLDEPSILML